MRANTSGIIITLGKVLRRRENGLMNDRKMRPIKQDLGATTRFLRGGDDGGGC